MSDADKNITLKQLYDEIVKNRTEIKHWIEASEIKLEKKIEDQKNTTAELQKENQKLRSEINETKKLEKRNNIVVFGLYQRSEKPPCDQLCQRLNALLSVSVLEADINNFYFLGKTEKSPLKIEFTRFLSKLEVFKNIKQLKGTGITILNDLTQEERSEQKLLKKYLSRAKNQKKTCHIKNNELYIEDKVYTVSDLQKLENQQSGASTESVTDIGTCEAFRHREDTRLDNKHSTLKPPSQKPATRLQEKKGNK